jgi:hypothetical protein
MIPDHTEKSSTVFTNSHTQQSSEGGMLESDGAAYKHSTLGNREWIAVGPRR